MTMLQEASQDMGTRQNQPRKSALASKLLPYLAAVEAAAAQRETRERRVLHRLYRTRNQGEGEGEGGAEPRQVTGAEMLYALRRYARGDGLRQIVEDFKERDIGGVSEVGIFRAGQRFERWWGEGRQVGELNELIGLLAEADPYRDSLTRELVPALEGVAGSRSGLWLAKSFLKSSALPGTARATGFRGCARKETLLALCPSPPAHGIEPSWSSINRYRRRAILWIKVRASLEHRE